MAGLWERFQNAWDRTVENPASPREEKEAAEQALAAQRQAGRDEVALEVTAALQKIRTEIRQDWTQEAAEQKAAPADLMAKYQPRIDDYNRVALGLIAVSDEKLSVTVANVIHPEEMARGISLTLEQAAIGKEQSSGQPSSPVAAGIRVEETLREIRESWVQDLQTNQMRPAQAELYYAGRFDQFRESVSQFQVGRAEQREVVPELPAFSEVKAQVQEQLRQVNQQSESIAI